MSDVAQEKMSSVAEKQSESEGKVQLSHNQKEEEENWKNNNESSSLIQDFNDNDAISVEENSNQPQLINFFKEAYGDNEELSKRAELDAENNVNHQGTTNMISESFDASIVPTSHIPEGFAKKMTEAEEMNIVPQTFAPEGSTGIKQDTFDDFIVPESHIPEGLAGKILEIEETNVIPQTYAQEGSTGVTSAHFDEVVIPETHIPEGFAGNTIDKQETLDEPEIDEKKDITSYVDNIIIPETHVPEGASGIAATSFGDIIEHHITEGFAVKSSEVDESLVVPETHALEGLSGNTFTDINDVLIPETSTSEINAASSENFDDFITPETRIPEGSGGLTSQIVDEVIVPQANEPQGVSGNLNKTDDLSEVKEKENIPRFTPPLVEEVVVPETLISEEGQIGRPIEETEKLEEEIPAISNKDDGFYEYSDDSPNKVVYEEPNGCIIEIYEDVEMEDDSSQKSFLQDYTDDEAENFQSQQFESENFEKVSEDGDEKLDFEDQTAGIGNREPSPFNRQEQQIVNYLEDHYMDDLIESESLSQKNLLETNKEESSINDQVEENGDSPIVQQQPSTPVAEQPSNEVDEPANFGSLKRLEQPRKKCVSVDFDNSDLYMERHEGLQQYPQQQQLQQRDGSGCLRRFIRRVANFFNCV